MRYARLKDDLVVNVIIWDGVTPYPGGDLVEVPEDSPVSIGWARENGEWIEPATEPMPEPPADPAYEQKLAAMQKLMDDFGFTEAMARAVAGLPPLDSP